MRRMTLILAALAVLGLMAGTAVAGSPSHHGSRVEFSLVSHPHHGHHGHYGHHHWRPGPGPVVFFAPAPRPVVVVPAPAYAPAYPAYYYSVPPRTSIGVFGRKFGVSVDF